MLRGDYQSLADAQQQIGYFIEETYARKRIHSALGYLTPAEFEGAVLTKHSLKFWYFVSRFLGPLHRGGLGGLCGKSN